MYDVGACVACLCMWMFQTRLGIKRVELSRASRLSALFPQHVELRRCQRVLPLRIILCARTSSAARARLIMTCTGFHGQHPFCCAPDRGVVGGNRGRRCMLPRPARKHMPTVRSSRCSCSAEHLSGEVLTSHKHLRAPHHATPCNTHIRPPPHTLVM